jgi:hypothetical protein
MVNHCMAEWSSPRWLGQVNGSSSLAHSSPHLVPPVNAFAVRFFLFNSFQIFLANLGAPRLLQSIAKDDVIPFLRPFAKVTKKNEVNYLENI